MESVQTNGSVQSPANRVSTDKWDLHRVQQMESVQTKGSVQSPANVVSTNKWDLHRLQKLESACSLATADIDRAALQPNTATEKLPVAILQFALEGLRTISDLMVLNTGVAEKKSEHIE